MVGKYVQIRDSYMSLNEALMHARPASRARASTSTTSSPRTSSSTARALLEGMDAILVPGGFGERGIEGKIQAVRYAREHGIPYLGICLGMQVADHRVRAQRARPARTRTAPSSTARRRIPVIALITEWQDQAHGAQQRDEASEQGRHDAPRRAGSAARRRHARARRSTART